jgi:hypothetical protein
LQTFIGVIPEAAQRLSGTHEHSVFKCLREPCRVGVLRETGMTLKGCSPPLAVIPKVRSSEVDVSLTRGE